MAQRYARVDVEFMHKNTALQLRRRLGRDGQLVFLALILKAKDGSPPGTFSYSSEAVAWEKLGFDGEDMPFTLDEFFRVLGQLKQSSRRRLGLVWNVSLTRWGDWQKESRRYEEATRKARKRRENAADTKRTQHGTRSGRKGGPRTRTRSISTPTPRANGTNPRAKGTAPRQTGTAPRDLGTNPRAQRQPDHEHLCHLCPTRGYPKPWTAEQLAEHLAYAHNIVDGQEVAA